MGAIRANSKVSPKYLFYMLASNNFNIYLQSQITGVNINNLNQKILYEYVCIPATTIEILLLYAFRLFYQQYLFVKSELLQVNLRHSLCAFIESYMEFKKDNKDNTVDLFEQLIFSNIISDEKKVPATVDGLESIAELIRCVKK